MSILSLLVLVFLVCLVIWGTRALLAAFSIPDPWRTVIWVAVVLLVVYIVLGQLGIAPGLRL